MTIRAIPLSERLGVEVQGLDLREPLSAAQRGELLALMDVHAMLVFRGQKLSPEGQISVVNLFGPVADEYEEGRLYTELSNKGGRLGEGPLPFHSDLTYTPSPFLYISLYGETLQGAAAPTEFVSLVRGYSTLPRELKARVEGRSTTHMHQHVEGADVIRTLPDFAPEPDKSEYPTLEQFPRWTWPVVRTHPRTGKPMLYVSEMHSHIVGPDREEAEALLADLFNHLYARENVYTHHWAEGDLVLWDNLAVQHGRRSFAGLGAVRTLRRVIATEEGRSAYQVYALDGREYPKLYRTVFREPETAGAPGSRT
jgi:taurine dioxygenase